VAPDGLLVTCADAPLLDRLDLPRRRERYGFAAHADWGIGGYEARAGGGCAFDLRAPDGLSQHIQLRVSGRHNASNAVAAVAAARWAGVDLASARDALAGFRGTRRRFERKGARSGALVVDDYAHHPTELRATLAAARGAHPGRILAVFQPHTANRTANLLDEFARAFGDADRVILLPIYQPAGREPEPLAVSSDDLARALSGPPVEVATSLDDAVERVERLARPGDLVLTLGAGDVYLVGERFLARGAAP
jgi:UDP-N-acetylmuramate--alanine ligase